MQNLIKYQIFLVRKVRRQRITGDKNCDVMSILYIHADGDSNSMPILYMSRYDTKSNIQRMKI